MFEASGQDRTDHRVDATLATLVPRPSVLRNVVAVALSAAVLVAVGLAPDYVKPQVTGGGGTSQLLRVSGSVVTNTEWTVTSKLDVDLVAIDPAPGAELVGAWMLTPAEMERVYAAPDIEDQDALRTLELRYQGQAPLDSLRLPQHLSTGESAYLVLLWRITDCSALRPHFIPELTLRSASGMTTRVPLTDFAGPTFDIHDLTSQGVCDPATTPRDPADPWKWDSSD